MKAAPRYEAPALWDGKSRVIILRRVLASFIVSNTPTYKMSTLWGGMEKTDMQKRHILFQEEDGDSYVRTMLEAAAVAGGAV